MDHHVQGQEAIDKSECNSSKSSTSGKGISGAVMSGFMGIVSRITSGFQMLATPLGLGFGKRGDKVLMKIESEDEANTNSDSDFGSASDDSDILMDIDDDDNNPNPGIGIGNEKPRIEVELHGKMNDIDIGDEVSLVNVDIDVEKTIVTQREPKPALNMKIECTSPNSMDSGSETAMSLKKLINSQAETVEEAKPKEIQTSELPLSITVKDNASLELERSEAKDSAMSTSAKVKQQNPADPDLKQTAIDNVYLLSSSSSRSGSLNLKVPFVLVERTIVEVHPSKSEATSSSVVSASNPNANGVAESTLALASSEAHSKPASSSFSSSSSVSSTIITSNSNPTGASALAADSRSLNIGTAAYSPAKDNKTPVVLVERLNQEYLDRHYPQFMAKSTSISQCLSQSQSPSRRRKSVDLVSGDDSSSSPSSNTRNKVKLMLSEKDHHQGLFQDSNSKPSKRKANADANTEVGSQNQNQSLALDFQETEECFSLDASEVEVPPTLNVVDDDDVGFDIQHSRTPSKKTKKHE